jgi:hypothetical protein
MRVGKQCHPFANQRGTVVIRWRRSLPAADPWWFLAHTEHRRSKKMPTDQRMLSYAVNHGHAGVGGNPSR